MDALFALDSLGSCDPLWAYGPVLSWGSDWPHRTLRPVNTRSAICTINARITLIPLRTRRPNSTISTSGSDRTRHR